MGAYNTLRSSVACSSCGAVTERAIQFKYGNKWLYDYKIGDTLRWGGNDAGIPGAARVRVGGYAASECSTCGSMRSTTSSRLIVNVITGVRAVGYDDLGIPPHETFLVEEQ